MSSPGLTGPSLKDEDGGPSIPWSITIEVALNGFFVNIGYSEPDISDERYVVQTTDELLELIRSKV